MNTFGALNWSLWGSLLALLSFSELAAANFKRLAPILEALDQKQNKGQDQEAAPNTFLWTGGWEKLAALCWAFGSALPFIVFSLGCLFFVPQEDTSGQLIVGSGIGGNIVALSVTFALILSRGPMSFFRIRTITSPIFLLLATVAFAVVCLDERISRWEGLFLVFMGVAYALYFRRFSSEWKSWERHHAAHSLLESTEGILPAISVFCMGLGFTVLAVLFSFPFVRFVSTGGAPASLSSLAVHIIAPILALPNILRALYSAVLSDSARALTLTGIAHTCLLNTLFLTGSIALYSGLPVALPILRVDLAVLLLLTGIFVATLLIEKERDRGLSWVLILGFLVYTGLGILL